MPVALSVLSARPASHGPLQTPRPWARVVSGPKTRPSRNGVIGIVCLPATDAWVSPAVGDDLKVCAPSSSFASLGRIALSLRPDLIYDRHREHSPAQPARWSLGAFTARLQ